MSAGTGVIIDTATILGAAYRYTACGLAVFPAEAGGKQPIEVAAGSRYRWGAHRTPLSLDAAERLFPQKPARNIAIICGAPSGGVVVLDVDGRLGLEGVLDALPELRDTWVVRTGRTEPGPGFHLFLRAAGKVPTIQGAAFHDELGVDVKAEGSYVIAAPSLHASGAFYQTERGEPEAIARVGDLRAFLARLLAGLGFEK